MEATIGFVGDDRVERAEGRGKRTTGAAAVSRSVSGISTAEESPGSSPGADPRQVLN